MTRLLRESGLWLPLAALIVVGSGVAVLDVFFWDRNSGPGILTEAHGFVMDIVVFGLLLATYDHLRRRREEIEAIQKELSRLRTWVEPEGVFRKVELLAALAEKGRKPRNLNHFALSTALLAGHDFSEVGMRFTLLKGAQLAAANFRGADLFCADFSNANLVEADFTGANLTEAKFDGALLSNAILSTANIHNADLRGAVDLTPVQLKSARNWEETYRDSALACDANVKDPARKALGNKFRELLRERGDPLYPYRLVRVIHPDGREETRVENEDQPARRRPTQR